MIAQEKTGLPFTDLLETCVDLPHTVTTAITHRAHIESIYEIPKDKRPPKAIWDKPYRLQEHIDHMFDDKDTKNTKTYADIDFDEAE